VIAHVKIDEDLPRQVADLVAGRGYDVATVMGQGWQGLSDDELWPRIQDEGRWPITADKGFADLRLHPAWSHAGVILLRAWEESRRAYLELALLRLIGSSSTTLPALLW
jgi:predicted nuclease of predicted toxin-antitoxin system